jgi:hypothetical protein
MFRDASQPVRSNKPTPTVCVIRLLIVIPPTTPEFKLHPATRSPSSHRKGPPGSSVRTSPRTVRTSASGSEQGPGSSPIQGVGSIGLK